MRPFQGYGSAGRRRLPVLRKQNSARALPTNPYPLPTNPPRDPHHILQQMSVTPMLPQPTEDRSYSPLLKKGKNKSDIKFYRPVSLLPTLGKIHTGEITFKTTQPPPQKK
ncbi:hypothetical protein AVEN_62002-1 [Araneus ventricosus]|uniref:Uncharacterized protein n=1 Tax=Araneus ventricosus TaxID=182803 RepID=A0A4Y2EA33_ARAVE|nr:hypothetical protein AVEN_62002-1 [Araneus ventricosus]